MILNTIANDHFVCLLFIQILGLVVTKDAAILSPMRGGIHPTFYPSEEDNSGVIVFKKHSPRLQLNVSFAKVTIRLVLQEFLIHFPFYELER